MSRERLVRLLTRDIPEYRGLRLLWKAEAIYPCRGYWRIRRNMLDVQSWQATAFDAARPDHAVWTGGCWETITECLQAGKVEFNATQDTICPVLKSIQSTYAQPSKRGPATKRRAAR